MQLFLFTCVSDTKLDVNWRSLWNCRRKQFQIRTSFDSVIRNFLFTPIIVVFQIEKPSFLSIAIVILYKLTLILIRAI